MTGGNFSASRNYLATFCYILLQESVAGLNNERQDIFIFIGIKHFTVYRHVFKTYEKYPLAKI